jgi:lysophospholipase L1-like esterase
LAQPLHFYWLRVFVAWNILGPMNDINLPGITAIFSPGTRILFQGDSITDCNRGRNGAAGRELGEGYPFLIAAACTGSSAGGGPVFFNRGISGNKVADLAARWRKDALDLRPDVLSILIGVNDLWRHFDRGDALDFETITNTYDQLLEDAKAPSPGLKLVLCEPFILRGSATEKQWTEWQPQLIRMQAVVGQLAQKHVAKFVRFQQMFNAACQHAPAAHWLHDGVHPSAAGHRLMAEEWLKTVSSR